MKSMIAVAALALPLLAAERPVEIFRTHAGEMKITPVHHASLMIEAGGKVIHVDPWHEGNYDGLPAADIILITDIHGDHLDPSAIARVKKDETAVIAPAAVTKTVTEATALANGETKTMGAFTIEAVPMYNLTRGPSPGKFYHDKGRGNGYIVSYGGLRVHRGRYGGNSGNACAEEHRCGVCADEPALHDDRRGSCGRGEGIPSEGSLPVPLPGHGYESLREGIDGNRNRRSFA